MILTKHIYNKFLYHKNNNLFITGSNLSFLYDCITINSFQDKIQNNISFKNKDSIYIVDYSTSNKKKDIFLFISELVSSKNFFIKDSNKKVILLLSFDKFYERDFMKLNYIIQNSYESSVFLIHCIHTTGISRKFMNIYQSFTLPFVTFDTIIDQKSYKIIMNLLKNDFSKDSILKLRNLAYHYYMNNNSSISLIHLLIQGIGKNMYLPNPIKCDIIHDLSNLNTMYYQCYRKPIFFECMILCLFKHLENYTFNL